MVKSMTGYGAAEVVADNRRLSVEIKSVNHRYTDFNIKLPRVLNFAEDSVRKALLSYIARGKVDVYITLETYEDEDKQVVLNEALAKSYIGAMEQLSGLLQGQAPVSAADIARFPDVLKVVQEDVDQEKLQQDLLGVVKAAAESFVKMRVFEGERLKKDLIEQGDSVLEAVAVIEQRAPRIVQEFRSRIEARVRELLAGTEPDEGRLLTEVAVFADKVDINEELVRLKSHIQQMKTLLESEEPVGRKLDFLVQEMNREINTIGSKSNDLETAQVVVEVKSKLEKIREQVQNIE